VAVKLSQRRRNLYLFGLASFFNDAGSDMIAVLTPLWLRAHGAEALIPVASAVREGVPLLFNLISAKLSSLLGKLATTKAGYALSSLAKWAMAFSTTPSAFLSALFADRAGKGIRDPARDALLASLYSERKAKAFSLHQALDTLGSLTGGLLLLALSALPMELLLLLAAFIATFSLFPLFFVKAKDGVPSLTGRALPEVLLMGLPVFGVTIPLSISHSLSEGALYFILFNTAYAVSAYASHKLRRGLPLSYALLSLSALLFPFLPGLAFPLYGTALGFFKVSSLSYIAERAGGVKGIGLNEALLGLSLIGANLLFGMVESYTFFALLSLAFALGWMGKGRGGRL